MSAYLDYQGVPVLAADLSWYNVAPCGCASGVIVAEMLYGGEVYTTPERAAKEFHETAAHRKKAESKGWTMQLGHRSEVRERLAGCTHSPRYGVEPQERLEGYSWVAIRDGKRDHLLTEGWADIGKGEVVALCGATAYSFQWNDEWMHNLECGACEKKAKKTNATQGRLDFAGAAGESA